MKRIFYLGIVILMCFFAACEKEASNVVLTVDKATVAPGDTFTFSLSWDGTFESYSIFSKESADTDFIKWGISKNVNKKTLNRTWTEDDAGTYTYYISVYGCDLDVDDCPVKVESNEVTVVVQ